jgi:hypothetical protein
MICGRKDRTDHIIMMLELASVVLQGSLSKQRWVYVRLAGAERPAYYHEKKNPESYLDYRLT